MVPDLPYDRLVVPDDSEAPKASGRFAGLVRRRASTSRSASLGTTEYAARAAPPGRRRVRRGLLVALTVVAALGCGLNAGVFFASPAS